MTGSIFAEVIGDPISHSKSPIIHDFWIQRLGLVAAYEKQQVPADALASYFEQRKGDPDWRGCNVTLPHKVAALSLVDQVDERALTAGAVNTVLNEGGRLTGYNSDIQGILDALPERLMPRGSCVGLIGTGGAARAGLAACKIRGVGELRLAARSRSAGEDLLQEFGLAGAVHPLEDVDAFKAAHVIMNATPLGMAGKHKMPASLIEFIGSSTGKVVFDMVYAPLETDLLAAAREGGHIAVDGLEMLIGQAAAAFAMFFGAPAPREDDLSLRERLVT